MVWATSDGFPVSWRQVDDQYVVYHSGTGDTHLLNKNTFPILQHIQERPATVDELVHKFTHLADNQTDLKKDIQLLLSEWQYVGLVECKKID